MCIESCFVLENIIQKYERENIADALQSKTYSAGEPVVKQVKRIGIMCKWQIWDKYTWYTYFIPKTR